MAAARAEIGKHPYLWGAKVFTPTGPLDCSGFTRAVILAAGGPDIGLGTWFQRVYCKAQARQLLTMRHEYEAGDLLFWMNEGPETPSHVGIASGEGTVIEETATYGNVVESPVSPRWAQSFVEAWRIFS